MGNASPEVFALALREIHDLAARIARARDQTTHVDLVLLGDIVRSPAHRALVRGRARERGPPRGAALGHRGRRDRDHPPSGGRRARAGHPLHDPGHQRRGALDPPGRARAAASRRRGAALLHPRQPRPALPARRGAPRGHPGRARRRGRGGAPLAGLLPAPAGAAGVRHPRPPRARVGRVELPRVPPGRGRLGVHGRGLPPDAHRRRGDDGDGRARSRARSACGCATRARSPPGWRTASSGG